MAPQSVQPQALWQQYSQKISAYDLLELGPVLLPRQAMLKGVVNDREKTVTKQ
jgi:hypothetical protein